MTPDQLLEALRELSAAAVACSLAGGVQDAYAAHDIGAAFMLLDESLMRGEALPSPWQGTDAHPFGGVQVLEGGQCIARCGCGWQSNPYVHSPVNARASWCAHFAAVHGAGLGGDTTAR